MCIGQCVYAVVGSGLINVAANTYGWVWAIVANANAIIVYVYKLQLNIIIIKSIII